MRFASTEPHYAHPKEYELLRLFMDHPRSAFSREQLLERVWGYDYVGETRTVDVHVRTLRQKLGEAAACIETYEASDTVLPQPGPRIPTLGKGPGRRRRTRHVCGASRVKRRIFWAIVLVSFTILVFCSVLIIWVAHERMLSSFMGRLDVEAYYLRQGMSGTG